jgi:hypothetical protein
MNEKELAESVDEAFKADMPAPRLRLTLEVTSYSDLAVADLMAAFEDVIQDAVMLFNSSEIRLVDMEGNSLLEKGTPA